MFCVHLPSFVSFSVSELYSIWHYEDRQNRLLRIQVERLTISVVAFVVTIELIVLRGKMTNVARREWQRSVWENHNVYFPRQNVVIPA